MRNHYIIGKQSTKTGTHLLFGKVDDVTKGIVTGTNERNIHIQKLRSGFEISLKDVIADLGTAPHKGTVHGFDVSTRFTGRKVHDFFGHLCFFYSPSKEAMKQILSAFDHSQKILTKAGFDFPEQATWELISKETKGKYAGMYNRSRDVNKVPHRFRLKPESVPSVDMPYVILHEVAHHLHAEYMTAPKLNAAWIKLYNTSIKPSTISKEESQALLSLLIEGEERPSDFKGQLEEKQRNAFNWIVRHIRSIHSVSLKELDTLFEADFRDEITKLWPQRLISQRELAPIVTEYATKNFSELVAESVAYYLTKKKLPSNVFNLVEKSISYARTQREK